MRGEFGDEVSAAHRTLQEVIRISEAPPKERTPVPLSRASLDSIRDAIRRQAARRNDGTFTFLEVVHYETERVGSEVNLLGPDHAPMIWRRLQWLANEGRFAGVSDRPAEIEPAGEGRYKLTDAFKGPARIRTRERDTPCYRLIRRRRRDSNPRSSHCLEELDDASATRSWPGGEPASFQLVGLVPAALRSVPPSGVAFTERCRELCFLRGSWVAPGRFGLRSGFDGRPALSHCQLGRVPFAPA